MTKLPVVSGEKTIKAGSIVTRQRGSHVRLKKTTFERTISITVPLHDVLDRGTLKSIIRTAGLGTDDCQVTMIKKEAFIHHKNNFVYYTA